MKRYRIADTAIPGAHAQVWVEAYQVAARDRVAVRREDDTPDGQVAILPVAWLEEVKPPSIDDPVTLPLEVHLLQMKGQPQVTVRIAVFAHESAAYLTALGNDGHDGFLEGILSLEQCRDAARALWRLGTEDRGGPQGPLAVQQPGTGAD